MGPKLSADQRIIKKYRRIWQDNPISILERYSYLPLKTKELDRMNIRDFNREKLYEIVLWKIARFPEIDDILIEDLKAVARIKHGNHRKAENILNELLKCKNIALPMASTILRFINPNTFQIIDDRTFRIVMPKRAKYPQKTKKISDKYLHNTSKTYFEYLDRLIILSCDNIPFNLSDRIFYQLDKELGNRLS